MSSKPCFIHYLGPAGTHTNEAAKKFVELLGMTDVTYVAEPSIAQVIREVQSADEKDMTVLGCVPLENSIQGSVTMTWDRLMRAAYENGASQAAALWNPSQSSLETVAPRIITALTMRINHYLLSTHDVDVKSISEVYSHPQALAQCKEWLEEHVPHAAQFAVASTADAARQIAELGEPTKAAIGNKWAGELYNLCISHDPIQDTEGNATRFGLLSTSGYFIKDSKTYTEWTVAICLIGVQNQPGGLLSALKPFHDYGLNLTRIESRPVGDKLGTYVFYLDITLAEDPRSDAYRKVWETVVSVLDDLQIEVVQLGVYPLIGRS